MKILYECDLAGSRVHGMAHRIYQFSKLFVERGHEVRIVASSYSHLRLKNPKVKKQINVEKIDGIEYFWIKSPKYKSNGFKRVFHMLVYNLKLFLFAKQITKNFQPDIVISSGVSPLDFIGCYRVSKLSNANIIYEVGDLWPLTPIELGGMSKYNPFVILLQKIENFAYRNTDAVVSILPKAKEHMIKHGLDAEKFNYIPNGIVQASWSSGEGNWSDADKIMSIKQRGGVVVGYTGSHTISNDLFSLLDVAEKLKKENIYFIFVGKGTEKKSLINYANSKKGLKVLFLDAVKKEHIPKVLSLMDVLYTGLKKHSLYRFGIGLNKMFDYMMSGKPIIQAINSGNNPVKEAGCGISVEAENVDEISKAILRLSKMSLEDRKSLGARGKEYVLKNHEYNFLCENFLELIKKVKKNDTIFSTKDR